MNMSKDDWRGTNCKSKNAYHFLSVIGKPPWGSLIYYFGGKSLSTIP